MLLNVISYSLAAVIYLIFIYIILCANASYKYFEMYYLKKFIRIYYLKKCKLA